MNDRKPDWIAIVPLIVGVVLAAAAGVVANGVLRVLFFVFGALSLARGAGRYLRQTAPADEADKPDDV